MRSNWLSESSFTACSVIVSMLVEDDGDIQPAVFGNQSTLRRAAHRGETEDLAYLLLPVSTRGHGYRVYGVGLMRATEETRGALFNAAPARTP